MSKVFNGLMGLAVGLMLMAAPASARTCLNCASDSSGDCAGARQCKHPGEESSEARKACKKAGCKITGTGSCSTAANVKVCEVSFMTPVTPDYPVPDRATASGLGGAWDALVGQATR